MSRLIDRAFDRVDIGAHNPAGPMLTRWRVLSTRMFGIKVHHIHRADADRWLHDHPWSFWSIRLHGRYTEMLALTGPGGYVAPTFRTVRVGFVRYDRLHQITRVPRGGVWTIVVNGPRRHEWGMQDVHGHRRLASETFDHLAHYEGARRSERDRVTV